MTTLDMFLIIIGLTVIVLSATQGLLRVLIMFLIFYLVCIAAGMATLASDIIHDLAVSITSQLGGTPPPLKMAQTLVFVGLGFPLFIGGYFLSRAAFGDTSIPELKGLDNILGAIVGVILAVLIMALVSNTWGVAVNISRRPSPTWNAMRTAYYYSALRPLMLQVMTAYQKLLFVFSFTEYPLFFVPQY